MSIRRLTASLMALLIVSAFLIDLSPAPLQAQGNAPPVAITEYQLPTPNSNPGGIVVGSDQAVWFIESVANKIGRITTDGSLSEFRIPTANSSLDGQAFVGLGPDGAVWFTESLANKVGRVTTDGQFTEYPLSSSAMFASSGVTVSSAFPSAISTGPDGAVWFAERRVQKLARLNTDGRVSEFSLPSSPLGLIAGPDGALWYTAPAANKIGRMTTDGKVSEFTIPTANSFPLRHTVGPDGAIWFVENSADKIGRLTPDGKFSEYDVPGMGPVGITVGPDKAIWFTGYNSNEIGRMTSDGVLTNRYPVPTEKSSPYHLVAGPDGNLWFTEIDGNKIARLSLAPTILPKTGEQPTTAYILGLLLAGLLLIVLALAVRTRRVLPQ